MTTSPTINSLTTIRYTHSSVFYGLDNPSEVIYVLKDNDLIYATKESRCSKIKRGITRENNNRFAMK